MLHVYDNYIFLILIATFVLVLQDVSGVWILWTREMGAYAAKLS